ncbi:bifunctional pyr operon transcriptional regulator/uracil phosphoribosyltransferase PyrR [Actinoalloteichus hymeniacidonis]|uniref:Bifunctional protein PyrR n=1 Tax=Actinoalloteichus hymeniacidonis TaxID=340345 RepID=A0AAC9HPI9_9PSEU|nr:bifunctional pyr operon transcriptional regulator/uracil phosphoribosyltransferase PyrR [Actinoalloteichus hymeniacidonis]AOS63109.1 pyrimidine operon attenuation protein/uracil phosphoribosyltransferase [Actinoalloteichus hymeniacidonis]MBB5908855.1 pyrimidine operon attenuation protein/uracil phosphoribosyltransferase [Actinoalloteichus hymeniacidonis]
MAPRSARAGATSSQERELLVGADVARTIARMAHQLIEKTALDASDAPRVVLLGIPTRGAPLARRLAAKITEFTGVTIPTGTVDVTLYRDDLRRRPNRPLEPTSLPDGGLDDALVVLVDDVLFSGRTVRAALDALRDHGRPSAVQLAVLIDRGHRELPIRADYVGKNVPTARREEVLVRLAELDGADAVLLRRSESDVAAEDHTPEDAG